jgi:uncharacterized protein
MNLVDALAAPAAALLDPSARVFLPFLVSAGVIATVAAAGRGLAAAGAWRRLLDRRVWWHRSARADYQLIFARAALRALLFGAATWSALAIAALVAGWLRRHVGDSALVDRLSPVSAGAIFTLLAFLIEDGSRFALHLAMHRMPALWAFHKVHHSAEVMTPFTLYRTHPVEALLNEARGVVTIGAATGLCAWAFGPHLRAWQILGVDAIAFVWMLLGANLRHSHVWISFGPRWERLFLSPAQHQVHHSTAARHADRNYGTVLSIWDALAGTLYVTRERERLRFGLPGEPSPGVVALLLQPFAEALTVLRPTLVRVTVVLGAGALLASCADKKFDRAALLSAMGQNTLDLYKRFRTDAQALAVASKAFADAPSETTRSAARTAWTSAIATWQEAEMLRYGPLGQTDQPGGQGLREQIYAWPLVTRCFIEQQLVSQGYASGVAGLGVDVRGLGAIEFLLFASEATNQCGTSDPINTSGDWAKLTAQELMARRAAYASQAAADVLARTDALIGAWEGGFLAELKRAADGSTTFPTLKLAFDTIAAGLFYADTDLKDRKLAVPLGLKECPLGSCTMAPESEWAGKGKAHLRGNLVGMRLLLEGGTAPASTLGFDDQLEAAGAAPLATQVRADLAAALAAVDALPDAPLADTVIGQPQALQTVYDRVKDLTDFLKMEFTTALQISAPMRGGGDPD